jgi:hypothetical protein
VFEMPPPALNDAQRIAVVQRAHLEPLLRRIDCSTCHR